MSSQTGRKLTISVTRRVVCSLSIILGMVGCSGESRETKSAANLSAPELATTPGQMQGDPITRPYLTDIDQVSATPILMRFGDGTLLVQKQGGEKIELIPTPDPDKKPGPRKVPARNPAKAAKGKPTIESIPLPDAPMKIDPDAKPDADRPMKSEPNEISASDVIGQPDDYNTWPAPDVSLVVTGRQHGYIEPCGCTGLERQKGGMARRFTFMRQLQEKGWPLLPIDGGDQVRRFGHQAEIKLQQTTKALKEMKYQAVGFGPDDLRLGVGELLSVAAAESPEDALYISANVVLIDRTLMPQSKVVEQGGHRIGLTSILDPEKMEVDPGTDITVSPMVPATQAAIAELKEKQADFNVLLFFGEEEVGKKLAVDVPGFDLIVVSGGYGEPTFQPLPIEGSKTQMIVTGNKGMYAGLVGLYEDQPFKYARVPLTHEFADAPEMRKLMAEYQDQLKAIGLAGLGLLPPVPHSSGQKFVGTAACGKCHTNALDVWEGSGHAEATNDIIEPKEERGDVPRHFDPECLSCHVTGWNPQEYFPYESGYLSLDTSKHLVGNGCENCHGPGSDHVAAEQEGATVTADIRDQLRDSMKLPLEKAREKCMSCHDLDNSPDFHEDDAFEDIYWPEVEHYGKD